MARSGQIGEAFMILGSPGRTWADAVVQKWQLLQLLQLLLLLLLCCGSKPTGGWPAGAPKGRPQAS